MFSGDDIAAARDGMSVKNGKREAERSPRERRMTQPAAEEEA